MAENKSTVPGLLTRSGVGPSDLGERESGLALIFASAIFV